MDSNTLWTENQELRRIIKDMQKKIDRANDQAVSLHLALRSMSGQVVPPPFKHDSQNQPQSVN